MYSFTYVVYFRKNGEQVKKKLFTWNFQVHYMPNSFAAGIGRLAHIATAILVAWSQNKAQHPALRTRNNLSVSADADLYWGLTSVKNAPQLDGHVERGKDFPGT